MTAFSPAGYVELLEAIKAGRYRLRGFDVAEPAEQMLFLRHDVDVSLEDAIAMAELEHAHGIRATYLLMTRSVFYNLASPAGLAAVTRLRELGHWVGHHALHPHVDPVIDPGFDRVMAWHNPEPAYMADPVPGWVNVMEPRFTGDFEWTYRSDSNQAWRRGDPTEGRGLQGGDIRDVPDTDGTGIVCHADRLVHRDGDVDASAELAKVGRIAARLLDVLQPVRGQAAKRRHGCGHVPRSIRVDADPPDARPEQRVEDVPDRCDARLVIRQAVRADLDLDSPAPQHKHGLVHETGSIDRDF